MYCKSTLRFPSLVCCLIAAAALMLSSAGASMAFGQDATQPETKAHRDQRMAWWRQAKFGMFIHWGLYAIPAGEWKGNTNHAEWIRHTARIPIEEYDQFVEQFNPVKFDADAWVRLAKEAGMKYIVITSKHHDGFCLFDSKYTDYDVMSTPFKRDIMKELSDACRRHGLKICWYHSIMDWHHPDYLPRRGWEASRRPAGGADFDRFVEHLRNQVTELLTNYGEIGVMWFDGQWEGTWTHEYGQPLYDLCRRLQPSIIVNDRVDKGRKGHSGVVGTEYAGDFGTPEQHIPPTGLPGVDWETCMTMNRHWGYNKHDEDFKSTADLIRKLVDIASKNGNFLLNVGPTAEGLIPEESVVRLREIGRWMKVNGEAIYGTVASPFPNLTWGRCTTKYVGDDARLYLHVFDWPLDGSLVVPGLGNDAKRAYLLVQPQDMLTAKRSEGDVWLHIPTRAPDDICSVVVLEIAGRPVVYQSPVIEAAADILIRPLEIKLSTTSDVLDIHYTLDGSEPAADSPKYDSPLTVTKTTVVKARSYHRGRPVSAVAEAKFTKVVPLAAVEINGTAPGLACEMFKGDWSKLPEFDTLEPSRTETAANIGLHANDSAEYFGRRFSGYITVLQDDVYIFALTSDDGSRLTIGGTTVVDNDGLHGAREKRGVIALAAGMHPIKVEYFNKTGGASLNLKMAPTGRSLEPVRNSAFKHRK
jgi:alpha-L-fucosidase